MLAVLLLAGRPAAALDGPLIDVAVTPGDFVVQGIASGDELTHDFTTGDINGDGRTDLVVGAAWVDTSLLDGGEVYVFFGSPTIAGTVDLAASNADVTILAELGDGHLGHTLTMADLNHDGFDDLVLSAPTANAETGRSYVVFGSPTIGGVIDLADPGHRDLTVLAANPGDSIGYWQTSGDYNGDGIDDFVTTARLASPGGKVEAGAAYVVFGSPSIGGVIDLASESADVTILGAETDDRLGVHVATGDVNDDGVDDIILAAALLSDMQGGPALSRGKVHVIFGSPTLGGTIDLATDPSALTFIGVDALDGLGTGVAKGDFNGDDIDDLLMSARDAAGPANGKSQAGEVYVVFGPTAQSGTVDLAVDPPDLTVYGVDAGDVFGFFVWGDDIDNDGIDDLIVAAPEADGDANGKTDSGETYVIFGSPALSGTIDLAVEDPDIKILGADPGDALGFALGSVDLDNNGLTDLVLGAIRADGPGEARPDAGEMYVFYSDGAVPHILAASSGLSFGQVMLGDTADITVTLGNDGLADLNVTDLTTTNPVFSVISPAVPFTLSPGASQDVTVRFSPTVEQAEAGDLEITSDDPDEGLLSRPLSGEGVSALAVAFRINVGGPDYTDVNGDLFVADKAYVAGDFGFSGGSTGTFADPIAGTIDDALYQDMRGGNAYSYLFDLANGDYEVTLFFYEPFWSNPGERFFDVEIEGALLLNDYDVIAEAGAANTARQETFVVTVADGQLNIDFTGVLNFALVSAIAVVETEAVPVADIDVSPTSLDFGQIGLGDSADLVVTVENQGFADLNVTDLATTNPVFTVVSPAVPFTLATAASQDVTLRFSPTVEQAEAGDLEITSNDPDEGLASVALSGEGVADEPDIAVSATSLNFGQVALGDSADRVVTVENQGFADLNVTDLTTTNPVFTVVSPAVPFTLGQGASQDLTLRFSPTVEQAEAGDLEITSDDPDEGLVSIALSGEGATEVPAGFRINAGGPDFTDLNGNLFLADKAYVAGDFGFSGGATGSFPDPVAGTTDDALYQDMRGGSAFSYLFDLANGDYEVTLFFNETFWSNPGQRLFDVTVEGALILDDHDIISEAGAADTAQQETFIVTVGDGQLNIDFIGVVNFALVSAIAVVESNVAPVADIDVSPSSLNFGQVLLGDSADMMVTVENQGSADLNVTALDTTNGVFTVVGPAVPFTLGPGASQDVTVRFSPTLEQAEAGDLEITSDDPDEGLVTVPLSGEGVTVVAQPAFRINSGGPDFTDVNGDLFVANKTYVAGDFGASGGSTNTFASPVAGTTDDALYQDMRGGSAFSYLFDLPDGEYQVRLLFMEPWWSNPGERLFDVTVEGQLVLDDYDIVAAAGANFTAVEETVSVTVSDGQLNVDFSGVVNVALVSAIAVEPPSTTFVDVAGQVGLELSHDLGTLCTPGEDVEIGVGSAWADFDNDTDKDLFVTNRGGPNRLYRNDGDGNGDGLPDFTDVAAAMGVDDPTGAGHGAVFVDYDNDGDQDLFVTNWGGNTLYENQLVETGSVSFLDVTATAGIADGGRGVTAAWGDFDQDGLLDLYIAKHAECWDNLNSQDHLFRNAGDGSFDDVTDWLCAGAAPCFEVSGLGFAPGWLDVDNDDDLDLYLVNDSNGTTSGNVLWRNDGSDGLGGWIFTDVSVETGTDIVLNGMGLGIGDYDNNGFLDLAFSNVGANYLLENQDGTVFMDVSSAAGIQRATLPGGVDSVTWGTVFFDHDNDGLLDLMFAAGDFAASTQPNAFFANDGAGSFTDISAESGIDDLQRARNMSIVDLDDDGFVDVFVGNWGQAPLLFHNKSIERGNTNNWLTVTVEGTVSNRDAIGTRLTLDTPDGVSQIREITSGATHGGGDFRAAYFGLGANTSGDLTIRWPDGTVEVIGTVAANQALNFIEAP